MKRKGRLQKKLANGELDPKQTWLVNNMILMSDDGFKTSRSALGEINVDGQTYYGLIAEMVLSGYIESSKFVGGTIQIGEYIDADGNKKYNFEVDQNGNVTMSASNLDGYVTTEQMTSAITLSQTEIEANVVSKEGGDASSFGWKLLDESFTLNSNGEAVFVANKDGININGSGTFSGTVYATNGEFTGAIKGGTININDKFVVDNQGNVKISAGNIDGYTKNDSIISAINASKEGIKISADKLTIDAGDISIDASNIQLEGLVTANANFKIAMDGSIEAQNAKVSGEITATKGTIGGCEISDGVLKIKNANISEKLTAAQIDATNLSVSAANITGTLTANQIDATSLSVDAANISGKLTADQIDATNLSVDAANITGTLSADNIDTNGISVDAANITGTLTVLDKNDNVLLSAGDNTVSIGGWSVNNSSLTNGTHGNEYFIGLYSQYSNTKLKIGNVESNRWRIIAGNNKFGVTSDGVLSATNANIVGNITATSGDIGGWIIDNSGMAKYDESDRLISGVFSNFANTFGNYPVGDNMRNDWTLLVRDKFGVAENGKLYAKDAKIDGEITASTGSIGGWNIEPSVEFYMSEFMKSYSGPALTASWESDKDYIYSIYLTPMGIYTVETDNAAQTTSSRFKSWWNLA